MANQANAYYYPHPGWLQPGAVVVHEPAAAAAATVVNVQGLDGIDGDPNVALAEAKARRTHATKVLLGVVLHLLIAVGLLCIFRYVPGVKTSWIFSRDKIPNATVKDVGLDTYFAHTRFLAQMLVGMAIIAATFASAKAHEEPPASKKVSFCCYLIGLVVSGAVTAFPAAAICVWTPSTLIGFSFAVTIGLLLLCAPIACLTKRDLTTSGVWWLVLMLVVWILWCVGALIVSTVKGFKGDRDFLFLSLFIGANLILAFHCMWDCQLVFGGAHPRSRKHIPEGWIFCSWLLSALILTHCLLNVPLLSWALFGWEHMGYIG